MSKEKSVHLSVFFLFLAVAFIIVGIIQLLSYNFSNLVVITLIGAVISLLLANLFKPHNSFFKL